MGLWLRVTPWCLLMESIRSLGTEEGRSEHPKRAVLFPAVLHCVSQAGKQGMCCACRLQAARASLLEALVSNSTLAAALAEYQVSISIIAVVPPLAGLLVCIASGACQARGCHPQRHAFQPCSIYTPSMPPDIPAAECRC